MRAVYAGQSRSRIEGMTLRERFSFKYSFVYRAWGNTRTTPVGQAVRLAGVFGGNGPGWGVARAFFAPRIVRVSRAGQYANDFRPIIRSCIKCDAVRERILDLESWPGGKRGPCWRLSSVELRGLFAQELGEMYDSGSQGQKRGLSGHETGVLYDSAGPRGSVFRGRRALRPFHASARRRNPRSGTCLHFTTRTKEQTTIPL